MKIEFPILQSVLPVRSEGRDVYSTTTNDFVPGSIGACAANVRQFGRKCQWVRAPVGRPTCIGNAGLNKERPGNNSNIFHPLTLPSPTRGRGEYGSNFLAVPNAIFAKACLTRQRPSLEAELRGTAFPSWSSGTSKNCRRQIESDGENLARR